MGEGFKEQAKKKLLEKSKEGKKEPLEELEGLEDVPEEEEEAALEEGEEEEMPVKPVAKPGLKIPKIPKPVIEEGLEEKEEEPVKEADLNDLLNKEIALLQNDGVFRIQLLQGLDKVVEVLEKQNVNFERLFKLFEK